MNMALAFRQDVGFNFRHVIARVTGAPVHVALCFGDAVVIEADGSAVRQITRAQRFAAGEWVIVPCDVDEVQADIAFTYARRQIGKGYDWWGVLFAWWAGRPAGNGVSNRWFCSELAAACLMAAGVRMSCDRAAYFTPRRLFDWCAPWR